jgi:hypothetical protein
MCENRVLRRIFGPKREEVAAGWRKPHNEELRNLYTSPNIIRVVIAQSVWRWATGWTVGVRGFDSRRGLGIFLFAASRTALGPTQPPLQWIPRSLSLGVKRPGRESDHSPPPSAEVKE